MEEEEPKRHWLHPIDSALLWCGRENTKPGYGLSSEISVAPSEMTCVDCLHKHIERGAAWWWQVHRLYYGSACDSTSGHNCEA